MDSLAQRLEGWRAAARLRDRRRPQELQRYAEAARQPEQAELEGGAGQLVDLPRGRNGGELPAEDAEGRSEPQDREVPVAKHRHRRGLAHARSLYRTGQLDTPSWTSLWSGDAKLLK